MKAPLTGGFFHANVPALAHNEITAARTLLRRVNERHDLSGKVVVLDALDTSFACVWLAKPKRQKQKMSTRDFQNHLKAEDTRKAFALVTSLNPKAWKAG